MEKTSKNNVYWTLLNHSHWNMYIAATTEGLCFIGTPNAPFEELVVWVKKRLPSHMLMEEPDILQPHAVELVDYLKEQRRDFILPIDLHGTPFQQIVWKALQEIPYGQTVSYSDIAKRIEKPNAVRAVGTAIGANPVLIVVPCHRVIAKNGKLGGFRAGLEMKVQLLELEG
ncbi:methylated-DNA--[protein]-cysteine S-methyltransferase [Sporosarcina sp. ANT_H38]|uniref:methylated-DNA--[protein]-cysteine S-methyltransferase n=1 Tax=Sporosarcina sp. ANT_H38 TaxID=2597358 RepID=UPI0011F31C0A|nr:methylated-DNA--[protein]-cysteine S-methyltransferase [Sporosarcina sp. ANT_H38]KAA0941675.1 methylated-DNA--[protein]-cysteine S-methyltransferase [Sporosarcina sp. ANT_H38]